MTAGFYRRCFLTGAALLLALLMAGSATRAIAADIRSLEDQSALDEQDSHLVTLVGHDPIFHVYTTFLYYSHPDRGACRQAALIPGHDYRAPPALV